MCFPVNFAKFLEHFFLWNTSADCSLLIVTSCNSPEDCGTISVLFIESFKLPDKDFLFLKINMT